MYTELSHYLLMLAVFIAFNLKHRNLFWIVSLYFVMVTISFFTAIACYMCSDLSIYNLFTNSNANTPLFFKIAATWSNHEGSLLLWCWLLSVYGFWFCYLVKPWNHSLQSLENEVSYVRQLDPKSWLYFLCSDKEAQRLQAQALFVYVYILLFFHAFLLTTSNPFLKIPFLCVNSVAELNPVLQDPILAIHPPCIYAGYVASAIGFSLCLSKCIQGAPAQHIQSSNGIPLPSDPAVFGRLLHPSERVYTKTTHFWTELWTLIRVWILICWCFLTIGILLGSWWAYHELGWGGWWFWDPVENASLMPWLLATACIHSVLVPRLNAWTLFLNQFTFVLSILGTFFVRSGLLASVHSFATDSTRGMFILCFLVAIIAISALNLGVYSSDKRGTKLYAQRFWSSPRSHSSSAGKLLLQKRSEQYLGLYTTYRCAPSNAPSSAKGSSEFEHSPPEDAQRYQGRAAVPRCPAPKGGRREKEHRRDEGATKERTNGPKLEEKGAERAEGTKERAEGTKERAEGATNGSQRQMGAQHSKANPRLFVYATPPASVRSTAHLGSPEFWWRSQPLRAIAGLQRHDEGPTNAPPGAAGPAPKGASGRPNGVRSILPRCPAPKGGRRKGAKGFSTSRCKSGGTIAEAQLLFSSLRLPLVAVLFMRRRAALKRRAVKKPPGSAGCSLKLASPVIAASAKLRIKALKHFVPADESSSYFGAAIRDGGCFCMSIAESITGTVRHATRFLNEPKFVVAQRSHRIVTRIEQLLQMQNGCFLLICVVVLCGTAAPILFQALLERDVSTGAPFFNGTIVPIFTCVLLLLLYVQVLVYSAVGKRTKRLQLKEGLARSAAPGDAFVAPFGRRPTGGAKHGFTGEEMAPRAVKPTRVARPSAERADQRMRAAQGAKPSSLWLHQTISLWLNQRLAETKELYCVLILMVLHWFLFKHFAGLSCLESAYAVICFVLFCTVILVLSIEISTQTRHETANVASRFVAFSAQCYKNTITPVGLNMQTAHAGIVLFLIGVLVSNRNQTQWTQIMRSGYAVRLGHHICCLRGIDHNYGPTFRSICGNLVVYQRARIDPATTTHPIVVANLRQPSFGQARQNLLGPQVPTLEGAQLVRSGYAADYGRCDILGAEGLLRHLFVSDSFLMALLAHPSSPLLTSPCAAHLIGWLEGPTNGRVPKMRFAHPPSSAPTQFHHAFGMFPEKRFFFSNQELSTTKVAIHTNLFSDIYALIGAGSAETGWFVTIMQLPFIGCIWVGFLLASIGGVNSLLTLFSLKRKLNWL